MTGSSVPVSAAVEHGAADVSRELAATESNVTPSVVIDIAAADSVDGAVDGESDEIDRGADMAWDGPDAMLVGTIDTVTAQVAPTDLLVSGGGRADSTLLLSGSALAPASVPDAGEETEPSEALVEGDEAVQVAGEADAGEVIAQEPVEGQRVQNGDGSRRGLVERQLRRSRKAGSPLDQVAERAGGGGCGGESVDSGGSGAATGKRTGSEEQDKQGGDHRSVSGRAEKKPVSQRKPREARWAQGFNNEEKVGCGNVTAYVYYSLCRVHAL